MSSSNVNESFESNARDFLFVRGEIRCFNRWIIVVVGKKLSQYYQSLYALEYPYKPKFQIPLWGAHVSVVRGECVIPDDVKRAFQGEVIVAYKPEIQTNGVHFWFPADDNYWRLIRTWCGLGEPICPFHLSIGNICNGTGTTQPESFSGITSVCSNAE